jgi:DnaK suppressor protein
LGNLCFQGLPAARRGRRKLAEEVTGTMTPSKKSVSRATVKGMKKSGSKTARKGTKTGAKKPAGKTSARGTPKKGVPKAATKRKPANKGTVKKSSTSRAGTARPARLTAKERRDFHDRLVAIRARVVEQIDSLKNSSLRREDNVVSEEDGTDAFDRQFALDLVRSEEDVLFQISEALQRLDDGTYGICDGCQCLIEFPRLQALPFVRRCVRCQSEIEKRAPNLHRVTLRG